MTERAIDAAQLSAALSAIEDEYLWDAASALATATEIERQAAGLGARELWRGAQGPHRWVTMADPEGNEFCVA